VAVAEDGGEVLGAYTVPVVVHVYLRRLLDRGRRRWERVSGPHRNGDWRGTVRAVSGRERRHRHTNSVTKPAAPTPAMTTTVITSA
jgi:hypothetical protein